VGTIVCFRVGAEDAEFLEKEFTPEFLAPDFVNLTKYNVYMRLMIDGLAGRPFSAQTLAPFPLPEKSNREKIIRVSRERYATQRKDIEEKITRWLGETVSTASSPVMPASGTVLYDAQCALCSKWTKVVFPPDGSRPIYCKSCRKKIESDKGKGVEPSFVKASESEEKPISFEEAIKKESLPFSLKKKTESTIPGSAVSKDLPVPRERKIVDVEDLKKTLEETLKSAEEEKNQKKENEEPQS